MSCNKRKERRKQGKERRKKEERQEGRKEKKERRKERKKEEGKEKKEERKKTTQKNRKGRKKKKKQKYKRRFTCTRKTNLGYNLARAIAADAAGTRHLLAAAHIVSGRGRQTFCWNSLAVCGVHEGKGKGKAIEQVTLVAK